MNRRVRNRTHGGVGGRGRRLPLLPDRPAAKALFWAKTVSGIEIINSVVQCIQSFRNLDRVVEGIIIRDDRP